TESLVSRKPGTVQFIGESEWILYTGSGYLLHLEAWSFPVLRLKRLGLSKACRQRQHRFSSAVALD
ncbi:hypothetical protein JJB97_18210, partial [Enterobacterales bacterium BIT-L3]|nr:hypothetical protein [Tenebrionibacter intestinalis]